MEGTNISSLGGRDKNRINQRRKDKNKYKPNSTKNPKFVPQKLRPNLGTNVDRYDKEDTSETTELSSSTDFSILANAPISQGQHFQFKQDKLIAEEVNKKSHELFTLDLTMLSQSILTIPFHERIGIDEGYFSENQIKWMRRDAEDSLIKYKEDYACIECKDKVSQEIDDNVDSSYDEGASGDDSVEVTKESEVIAKVQNTSKVETKPVIETSEEDLEQWLEDFLNE